MYRQIQWMCFTLNILISQMHHRINLSYNRWHTIYDDCECVSFILDAQKHSVVNFCEMVHWDDKTIEPEKDREREWELKLETKSNKTKKLNSQCVVVCVHWMLFYSRFSSTMWYLCVGGLMHIKQNHKCVCESSLMLYMRKHSHLPMHECDLCVFMCERDYLCEQTRNDRKCAHLFFILFHFYLSSKSYFFSLFFYVFFLVFTWIECTQCE